MKELTIFKGHTVRIVDKNGNDWWQTRLGEPWWVAKDVCDILGLKNPTEATRGLDTDEVLKLRNSEFQNTRGGARYILAVNEPGLYRLMARSTKQAAKTFQRWIYHEILPAIRKTGMYRMEGVTVFDMIKQGTREWLQTQLIDNFPRLIRDIKNEQGAQNGYYTSAQMSHKCRIKGGNGYGQGPRTQFFKLMKEFGVLDPASGNILPGWEHFMYYEEMHKGGKVVRALRFSRDAGEQFIDIFRQLLIINQVG